METVFPLCYFPSIGYVEKLIQFPTVTFEIHEHFPKQSYRNRCKINSANSLLDLSVPLIKENGNKTPYHAIRVDDSKDWRSLHWKSISSAYQSSPYFEHYSSEFKELIFYPSESLAEINLNITKKLLELCHFDIELLKTKEFKLQQFPEHNELASKHAFQELSDAPYIQVFPGEDRFNKALSILDLICCEGPMAHKILQDLSK